MIDLTHAGLFDGIGGFSLAAEWAGYANIFHCENNPFGKKILDYYWPNAQSYGDITKTDFTIHQSKIDVLSGGFPCQGFSLAGKRQGTNDNRYLWPEMLRAIKESKPAWVIGENVTGILSMEDKTGTSKELFTKVEGRSIVRNVEIDKYEAVYTRQAKMLVNSICEDLEKEGFEVQTLSIPAASVQAPHKRDRIWFLAYSNRNAKLRRSQRIQEKAEKERIQERNKIFQFDQPNSLRRTPSNANGTRCKKQYISEEPKKEGFSSGGDNEIIANTQCFRSVQGECCRSSKLYKSNGKEERTATHSQDTYEQWDRICEKCRKITFGRCNSGKNGFENFPTQSPICTGNDGFSSKLDGITLSKWRKETIKGGGNAVVPQIPYIFFNYIKELSNEW